MNKLRSQGLKTQSRQNIDASGAWYATAISGVFTGASTRNWTGYGDAVGLGAGLPPAAQVLLTGPQTSGGLLAACAPAAVDDVLAVFRAAGFGRAAVIGEIVAGEPRVEVR